jgi:hypothetical protein
MQVQLCLYMYREIQGGEGRELVKSVQEKEPSLLVCALEPSLLVCALCVCVVLVHMFSVLI